MASAICLIPGSKRLGVNKVGWNAAFSRDQSPAALYDISDSEAELRRLAEFGRVSAALIHEISTPLTAASLTLEQLRQEQSDRLVKRAQRDLKQLESYIRAARQQLKGESRPSSFSLTVAIHQVVMILEARARALDVKLLVNTIGSIRIYGDQVKFHQVMANLINNAIDSFAPESGRPKIVWVRVTRQKDILTITVSDNGQGISRRNLGRIFEPFFSTKPTADKGLGIGLDTVKRYVEQDFQGTVKVKSRPSFGSSFIIRLNLGRGPSKGNSKHDVIKIK
jgi:two-component system C4-dicarboxylate transport sensor histidine kinase DctB